MGFLDRFKPQPRWRHPDAAVRLAAVEAMPGDEQDVLRGLALEDPDPSVRRAALARLEDVATIARLAREDLDEHVRADAHELAMGLARDATAEDAGKQALAALDDSRELTIVARGAELEAVAREALARLDDPRVISVVARQATHGAVRLAALARIASADEVLAVAAKTEHKDVGLAAVERIADRAGLELVAVRARNKVVARRARAAARALEEAEQVPQQQAARRAQLCEGVERLLRSPDLQGAATDLDAAIGEWAELADGADPGIAGRFAAAVGAVRELLARSEGERAAHEERARALADETAQAVSAREGICERVEGLAGEAIVPGLDEARTLWVALAPWPEAMKGSLEARQLEARFARACDDRAAALARDTAREKRHEMLTLLVAQAEEAVAREPFEAARAAFDPVRKAWQQAGALPAEDVSWIERFQACEARLAQRDRTARDARQREAAANLAKLATLAAQVEALAARPELTLKEAERALRELRAALDHPGPFPTRQDHDRTLEKLRGLQSQLTPRLQELRDAEDWRRWANATVQEELCAKAEALKEVADPADAAQQLRTLQQEWRKVGAAPREKAEALWQRFKTACDDTRARLSVFFAEQRRLETENLAAKVALCEQAEAQADSTDWIKTADELKRLQAEWQKIGPVSHDQARMVWERFRAACDRFFTRRKQDLHERKHVWAENQKKKEAICARAEELAESADWEATAAEFKRLQGEWKGIGPVKRSKSELLWQRFRTACDHFFERYKHRDQAALSETLAGREALIAEVEGLLAAAAAPGAGVEALPEDFGARVVRAWEQWQHAPRVARPLVEQVERRFETALMHALEAFPGRFIGTRLDVEANARRMEKLCQQVEGLAAGHVTATDLASAPPEALATLLKDALAANTIGGRVDEEAKRRAAVSTARDAQAHWRRLGPVPGDRGRELAARFSRACRRLELPAGGVQSGSRPVHA